jgi:Bax protein
MTKRSSFSKAQARSVSAAESAQANAAWAALSISVLAAAAAFGVGYDPFRQALEDRYGVSVFIRMTDENTVVRPDPRPAAPVALLLMDNSVKRFKLALSVHEFDLAAVRVGAHVPRVFVAALPQDIDQLKSVQEKRETFIRAVLPVILAVNERIATERRYILELRQRSETEEILRPSDQAWLAAIAERYRVVSKARGIDWNALLERVDVVPPSLALAQSIVETGWGSSAPARRSNALFGMIGGDGTDTAKLAGYDTLYASVAAYVHNLNTFAAYTEFRRQRAAARAAAKPLDGQVLANTLLRYSELGAEYTRHIQGVIDKEQLKPFDDARLIARAN